MASRIRVHQIDGVIGVVGLVCEGVGERMGADAGGGTPTDAVRVEASALADLLPTIDSAIETFVFLIADVTDVDAGATGRIALLVDRLVAAPDHVAAVRRVPAVNAAKRVHDGVVVEAVDRETLNLLRPPEVVNRHALQAALDRLGPTLDRVVNPTVLAASDGGRVLVVDDDVEPASGSTGSFNASS